MNYTKGEWKIRAIETGHILVYCDSGLIADVYNNINGYEANANLIAAAPDMYEALKFIITGKREDGKYDKYDAAGFIKIAEEALAKAEGK